MGQHNYDDSTRESHVKLVEQYLATKGQDRLKRHELFVETGSSGLWTSETGEHIMTHGKDNLAEHGAWSLKCFPDWEWINIKIYPGYDANIIWAECDGQGKICYEGYPEGYYKNHFVFSFEFEGDKLLRVREFMNPVLQLKALGIDVPKIERVGIPS